MVKNNKTESVLQCFFLSILNSKIEEMNYADTEIVDYKPEHQPYFEKFNTTWIEEFFEMETLDKYVLQHPEEALISKGGAILMALYKNEVAGTAALRYLGSDQYEFTKLAVEPAFRRKGIGEALTYAAIGKAKQLNAKKLVLYSNTKQEAAINMYRKMGLK